MQFFHDILLYKLLFYIVGRLVGGWVDKSFTGWVTGWWVWVDGYTTRNTAKNVHENPSKPTQNHDKTRKNNENPPQTTTTKTYEEHNDVSQNTHENPRNKHQTERKPSKTQ